LKKIEMIRKIRERQAKEIHNESKPEIIDYFRSRANYLKEQIVKKEIAGHWT